MGQSNVNQLPNQYLSQGQFPGAGPGVGSSQPGMGQASAQASMAQVRWHEVVFPVLKGNCVTSFYSVQPESLMEVMIHA